MSIPAAAPVISDNDSGYMSHYQESNSSLVSETPLTEIAPLRGPIYISEDALLEKPLIATQSNDLSFTDPEVMEASVGTTSTNYSGFQETPQSDKSVVIKPIGSITLNASTSTQDSVLNQSQSLTDSFITNDSSITESDVDYQISSFIEKQIVRRESSCSSLASSRTPQKVYKNSVNASLSPDLFTDEDDNEEDLDELNVSESRRTVVVKERFVQKCDQLLLRKAQKGLNGLLPPPSLKVVHLTVEDMLSRLHSNKHLLSNVSDNESVKKAQSLLFNCYSVLEAKTTAWPEVLQKRYHGLHHNRSKLSEKFEELCTKYALKYVGGETQSTCTVFDANNQSSPSKRKNKLRWMVKSPGRRLSHLARRRITFSSANLQNAGSSSGLQNRQILIDAKKIELLSRRKSPKKKSPRKTPRKSPRKRIKTPSSSVKKRFCHLEENQENSGPSASLLRASATKRALFQSPDKDKYKASILLPLTSKTGRSPFKKLTPKRALFASPVKKSPRRALFASPSKNSPSKSLMDNKRKRTDNDDNKPAKFARSVSMVDGNKLEGGSSSMSRTRSDTSILANFRGGHQGELSVHHKQKLQWAVYEALKSQKIASTHPQFKSYACVLARVTRRFLPNLSASAPRPEGGTSQRMLRIARQHVFAVTRGKSVDEIVQSVLESKSKQPTKPAGYVALNDKLIKDKENIFHDNGNIIANVKNAPDSANKPLKKIDNKIDRVRKVINFDGDCRR